MYIGIWPVLPDPSPMILIVKMYSLCLGGAEEEPRLDN